MRGRLMAASYFSDEFVENTSWITDVFCLPKTEVKVGTNSGIQFLGSETRSVGGACAAGSSGFRIRIGTFRCPQDGRASRGQSVCPGLDGQVRPEVLHPLGDRGLLARDLQLHRQALSRPEVHDGQRDADPEGSWWRVRHRASERLPSESRSSESAGRLGYQPDHQGCVQVNGAQSFWYARSG